jgi:hypothetical protein
MRLAICLFFTAITAAWGAPPRTVDLSTLDSAPPSGSGSTSSSFKPAISYSSGKSGGEKLFKVFFDLVLYSRPGVTDLSFGNFHSYVFLDILPRENVQFSFDLASARGSPSFYELDWQMTSWFQLRLGKIWIPFDDMSPHNLFGGRVNVSTLAPQGAAPFLPNLWTDLGVGAKLKMIDSTAVELDSYLYAVNGFNAEGSDPVNTGAPYPSFADVGLGDTRDNNQDKALGARAHLTIGRRFGLGTSFYTGRWSDQDDTPQRVNIFGVDMQLFLKSAEVRAGIITMRADVLADTITRGGAYGELGIPISKVKWLIRGGTRQQDDRVKDVTDQTIIGTSVIYRYDFMQLSFEYSRDIKNRELKAGKDFIGTRAVFEL